MCKHYKTIKQEHTKIVLCCFVWKGNQSFVLSYHIPLCCVPLTSTLFCSWTAVHVYFASLCLTQQNFSAWTDSACRVCGSCSICVDMRGSYVDRISTNIANCILSTVQPQPISLHGSLILCVPTSQIQEEQTSESEGWQNVSGALGSCCYCCTVVVSPNSPTETGWVTSHETGAPSIVAALKKPATTCDSRELT